MGAAVSQGNYRCIRSVVGDNVRGAAEGVFVVESWCLTGDGWANAVAFAHGRHGWGPVNGSTRRMTVAKTDSSGEAALEASRYDIRFSHGFLMTIDGNAFLGRPPTQFPYLTYWGWSHGALVDVHDNTFIGVPAATPDTSGAPLPGGACRADGTFLASFGIDGDSGADSFFARSRLLVFPRASGFPKHPGCAEWISSTLPVSVQVAKADTDDGENITSLTKRQWVTAPAWILMSGEDSFGEPVPFYETLGDGLSPWALPRIDANVLLSDVRDEPYKRFQEDEGQPPRPAWGTVTFEHGKVVNLAVLSTLAIPVP
jgi:hypothetical protein